MKASELMKLKEGDCFLMNRPEGPETCTITAVRIGEGWHMIHYRSRWREATIHIGDQDEELGPISLPAKP